MPTPDPNDAVRDLDRELDWGTRLLYCNAESVEQRKQKFPVAKLAPGQSLLDFWKLQFPIKGIDYNRPEVLSILRDMLGIRAMSPCDILGLTNRIKGLSDTYGNDGYGMAAMITIRARQALSDPYSFPGLMTEAELNDAYGTADRLGTGFAVVGNVLGGKQTAKAIVKKSAEKVADGALKSWMRRISNALGKLDMPPGMKRVANAATAINAMYWWTAFIAKSAEHIFDRDKNSYRDEMERRGFEVPK